MTPTQALLLTLGGTLVGSGLGTTIVGAFFKRRFDSQLETQKALLQRTGKIHERQVEAVLAIYEDLEGALALLQVTTKTNEFWDESAQIELRSRMVLCFFNATKGFAKNRLLFSKTLEKTLDEFFKQMFSEGIFPAFDHSTDRETGLTRFRLTAEAKESAHIKLPAVLSAIRDEARAIIHG